MFNFSPQNWWLREVFLHPTKEYRFYAGQNPMQFLGSLLNLGMFAPMNESGNDRALPGLAAYPLR